MKSLARLAIVLSLMALPLGAADPDDPPTAPTPTTPEPPAEPATETPASSEPTPPPPPPSSDAAEPPPPDAVPLPGEVPRDLPNASPPVEGPAQQVPGQTPANDAGEEAQNPCSSPVSFKEAWIDKIRRGVFYTVCGSASWFDNFFGDERSYDPKQVYGRISGGLLHESTGDWSERSKFDANVPLPNLSKRATAFLGRDNPEQFISDTSQSLSTPEAFRETSGDRSWLAGFGYNPPGKRGSRTSYRVGVKVSSEPYVFAQARYRYNRYTSKNTAFRFHETVFYRTNDDQFGSTTYVGYDWIPRRANLARVSAQGTVSDDTEGLKWKSYLTVYHDLERGSGKPRGIAYQLLANGETEEDVPLREYGSLVTYREQVLREWLFAEVSLGYSWVREELFEERDGGVTVGFVFEILFGEYYDR